MPIMLTRKDGPPTPFRNAEYIPFYYFIPKSILSRCGAELNAIPRNPQVLFHNRAACEFVESDLFRLLIIDATAFMVWPYDDHFTLIINASKKPLSIDNIPLDDIETAFESETEASEGCSSLNTPAPPNRKAYAQHGLFSIAPSVYIGVK